MNFIKLLFVVVLMGVAYAGQDNAPRDWANDALKKGNLRPWEKQWALRMVKGEYKAGVKVWTTNYGPWEGFKGDYYHIACNMLPLGTVVWLSNDKALKVVTNRGAKRNDSVARGKGASYWIDRWTKRARYDNACQRLYVVGRVKWPQ